MNARPYAHSSSSSITIAATVATLITLGLLSAIAFLFQHDGAPLAQLAAAERACAQHAYMSEREACAREWLAAARVSKVASK